MKSCLIVIDAQESFRQRPYFTATDMPAYLAAQNALIEGCIAQGVPVYEIRDAGGMTDTFVRDPRLAKALAQVLGDKPAVLQRGHGAVIVRRLRN